MKRLESRWNGVVAWLHRRNWHHAEYVLRSVLLARGIRGSWIG